jgi:hypothetical protein
MTYKVNNDEFDNYNDAFLYHLRKRDELREEISETIDKYYSEEIKSSQNGSKDRDKLVNVLLDTIMIKYKLVHITQ